MAQHHGITHGKLIESVRKQSGLVCCSPDTRARSSAMSKAWPVKAKNTMTRREKLGGSADYEILDHHAIAMEQHDAGSARITTIEIMQANAIALDETADWWVIPFRQYREHHVADNEQNKAGHDNEDDDFSGGHLRSLHAGSVKRTSGIAARQEPMCATTRTRTSCSLAASKKLPFRSSKGPKRLVNLATFIPINGACWWIWGACQAHPFSPC